MKKRLVIHTGFHKSGTTALQEALAENRKSLKENGVVYPSIGTKSHHRAAWSINEKVWGWKKRGGEKVSPKVWENLVKRINNSEADTVILSSEFFSELDGEKIRKISQDVKDREIEILFTLRPLVKLLPSSYQQYLKYGMKVKYEEWLHEIFNNREKTKVSPSFWKRHEHSKVIARWIDIFGANKVTVLIADEAKPEFLFQEVNSLLGLPTGTLVAAKRGSNRSLTMEEIALLIELNRRFPEDRDWDEYEVFVRGGYIRALTDHVKPSPDSEKLLTPQWAIDKGNEIGAQNRRDLITTKAKIIGDIESLDSAKVPAGESQYPVKVSIDVISQAMLTFDKSLVGRLPIRWLQRSMAKRYKGKLKKEIKRRRKKL